MSLESNNNGWRPFHEIHQHVLIAKQARLQAGADFQQLLRDVGAGRKRVQHTGQFTLVATTNNRQFDYRATLFNFEILDQTPQRFVVHVVVGC